MADSLFMREKTMETLLKKGKSVIYLPEFKLVDRYFEYVGDTCKVSTFDELNAYKSKYKAVYDVISMLYSNRIASIYRRSLSELSTIEVTQNRDPFLDQIVRRVGTVNSFNRNHVVGEQKQSTASISSEIILNTGEDINGNRKRFKPYTDAKKVFKSGPYASKAGKNYSILPVVSQNGVAVKIEGVDILPEFAYFTDEGTIEFYAELLNSLKLLNLPTEEFNAYDDGFKKLIEIGKLTANERGEGQDVFVRFAEMTRLAGRIFGFDMTKYVRRPKTARTLPQDVPQSQIVEPVKTDIGDVNKIILVGNVNIKPNYFDKSLIITPEGDKPFEVKQNGEELNLISKQ
ncbi:MAG: hypothetical protein IJ538_04785 [Clostridia bacterium]|nr:hypothetical protein [Clostridia bacterium]